MYLEKINVQEDSGVRQPMKSDLSKHGGFVDATIMSGICCVYSRVSTLPSLYPLTEKDMSASVHQVNVQPYGLHFLGFFQKVRSCFTSSMESGGFDAAG